MGRMMTRPRRYRNVKKRLETETFETETTTMRRCDNNTHAKVSGEKSTEDTLHSFIVERRDADEDKVT